MLAHLDYLHGAFDVIAFLDGFLGAAEGLVLHQLEPTGVEYQRVAGDARLRLVGFGKAAVDDEQLAVGLDGGLAFRSLYRHMAVDDMAVRALHIEAVENHVDGCLVVVVLVVVAFLFLVGLRVGYEVAFEGGHLVFVEQRGVGAAP